MLRTHRRGRERVGELDHEAKDEEVEMRDESRAAETRVCAHEERESVLRRQDPRGQAGHGENSQGQRPGLPQVALVTDALELASDAACGSRDAVVVDGAEGALHVDFAACGGECGVAAPGAGERDVEAVEEGAVHAGVL